MTYILIHHLFKYFGATILNTVTRKEVLDMKCLVSLRFVRNSFWSVFRKMGEETHVDFNGLHGTTYSRRF
jgi:hypothetical protein